MTASDDRETPSTPPDRDVPSVARSLTPEQSAALLQAAEKYRESQRGLMEAVGVLWNAQVDMAIAIDDPSLIERTLRKPLGLWDDCNCGCAPPPPPPF